MQKAQSSVWNDRWIAVTDVSRSDDPDPAHVNRLVPWTKNNTTTLFSNPMNFKIDLAITRRVFHRQLEKCHSYWFKWTNKIEFYLKFYFNFFY